jgi:hypothetical protein
LEQNASSSSPVLVSHEGTNSQPLAKIFFEKWTNNYLCGWLAQKNKELGAHSITFSSPQAPD